jgi:hypothetical protein
VVEVLVATVAVACVVALVAWPFFRPEADVDGEAQWREQLEIAKQVKYREIRDLELDYRAGKLERDDWQRLDGDLRREAMTILAELDTAPRDRERAE